MHSIRNVHQMNCLLYTSLEIHMSNIFNREDFRSHSVIAPVADGMLAGMGVSVYTMAVRAMAEMLENK